MTFKQKYPQSAAALQIRTDDPSWPYNTWRILADVTVAKEQQVFLTPSFPTENQAYEAAKTSFYKGLQIA